MGNITDIKFDYPTTVDDPLYDDRRELEAAAASLVEANAELVRLRIFRAAVEDVIPLLETHISRVKHTYPITSRVIADLINAFRASE